MPPASTHLPVSTLKPDNHDPFTYADDKSDSWSKSTNLTLLSSDSESASSSDESLLTPPHAPQQSGPKRSVLFSVVHMRENNVLEEPVSLSGSAGA